MRLFIGPTEIAGIANGLSKGFEQLGLEAQVVLSVRHSFQYGSYKNNFLIDVWQFLGGLRASPQQSFLRKVAFFLAHRAWGWCVFFWAIFKFDAFIFLFGCTFTNTRLELWLLRKLGKKIIFINCGSDIRPPYMDGRMASLASSPSNASRVAREVARIKRRAAVHERFSDFIVAQPSCAHFYQKPVINYFSMGVPASFDLDVRRETPSTGVVRVVHSPSNPALKGSKVICEAVQKLIDEGLPLELVCLQGVSNEVVLQQLRECDFVVDQLYSDLPIAVLGVEAAHFAKPCVLSGYMADNMESYIRMKDIPPSLYVRPEQLRQAIERLALDAELRRDLGLRAQEFVSQRWACKAVAERYLMLLNGQPQSEWWFDPVSITYLGGCGLPLASTAKLVDMLVGRYGKNALHVNDKPVLEKALVDLATGMRGA